MKILGKLAVVMLTLFSLPAVAQNAIPMLGIPGTLAGGVGLANGGASGAFVTILNPSATGAYNFNLPATAGTSGYLFTSAGGGSSPATWTSPTVTVNGVGCTLGATCSPTAVASSIAVGTTAITGGSSGYILYDNGGKVGEVSSVGPANGGTGEANDATNTITFSGHYGLTLTLSGPTSLTLPTSGTLETTASLNTISYDGDWWMTGNTDVSKMYIGGYATASGTLAGLLGGGDFCHWYFNHNVPTPSNGTFTTTADYTSTSYSLCLSDAGLMNVYEAPATGVPGNPPVFVATPTFSLNMLTGAMKLNGNSVATTATFAAPPAIGNTTPAAGSFTSVTLPSDTAVGGLLLGSYGNEISRRGSDGALLITGGQADIILAPAAGVDVRAGTDMNLRFTGHTDLATGVAISSLNDAYNAAEPLELYGSEIYLGGGSVGIGKAPGTLLDVNGIVTSTGLVTNPASGTVNPGIYSVQTGPNTSSQSGLAYYNTITVSDGVNNISGSNYSAALFIQMNELSNSQGQKTALFLDHEHANATTNAGDQIGLVVFNRSTASDGGTSIAPAGTMYASNPIVSCASGCTYYSIVEGEEIDVGVQSGGSTASRLGLSIVSFDVGVGGTYDAALDIYAAQGKWQNAIWLETIVRGSGGGIPLASTGCVICTDGQIGTIATGIDLTSYTITGAFLKSAGFEVAGSIVGLYAGNSTSTAITSVPGLAAHAYVSVAANASLGFSAANGVLVLYRDETVGGFAVVLVEGGVLPVILGQSGTNFVTTDPGSGGNKIFIQNAPSHYGDVLNRFSSPHQITYTVLTTHGGVLP